MLAEIEIATEALSNNKEIHNKPIRLSIYSNTLPNLSLIDLPGVVRNAQGGQPDDIEQITRALIRDYIKDDNVLILAISPMSQDFAAMESIRLAKDVDPDSKFPHYAMERMNSKPFPNSGERTLVVLTKLDTLETMENPARAAGLLSGAADETAGFKLGVIGVKNRSESDTTKKKTRDVCLAEEAVFFARHFPELAERNGIPYLTKKLQEVGDVDHR